MEESHFAKRHMNYAPRRSSKAEDQHKIVRSKEVLVARRRSLVLALSAADDQITRREGLWSSVCDPQHIEEKWDWWISKRNRTAAMQLSSHVQEVHGNAINSTCGYQGNNQMIYGRLKWQVNEKVNLYLSTPWRRIVAAEVYLHFFLTSALAGGK